MTAFPTIPYPGAKGRMAPAIVSFMPPAGKTYVEPLAGRGNVFWAAAESCKFEKWIINDISTARFFKALKGRGMSIRVPQRTRQEYERQKRCFAYGKDRAILLEPYLTFSGGGYAKGGFGGLRSASARGYAKTLRRCSGIMNATKAEIMGVDWKKLNLDRLAEDDFVFFDPPYFGADVRAYTNKFDFDGMVDLLKRARFKWILTEYRQPFYVKAFGEPFYERRVQLACDNIRTRHRTECMWKNY